MYLKTFTVGPFQVNNYLIGCEKNGKAALIDSGGFENDIIESILKQNNMNLEYILLTHGHLDHVSGARELQINLDVPVYINEEDHFLVKILEQQLALYGLPTSKPPEKLTFIKDSDIIKLGNIEIKVISTPGHSPGCVCYYIESEKLIFVGDTIFNESIGRTDLPGGSYDQLMKSIKEKLMILPDDTKVLSGHGPETTIGEEKLNNPFFGKNASQNVNL